MWRSVMSIIVLVLLAGNAAAFDLWDGAALFGNSSGKTYLPATKAYIARVQADGGTVIDADSVNNAFKMVTTNSLTIAAAYSPDWGVKKDGSNFVSKLYSLAGASSDLVQAVGAAQPLWVASGQNGKPILTMNGSSQFLKQTFTLAQPETILLTYKPNSWTVSDMVFDGGAVNTMALYQNSASPNLQMYNGNTVFSALPSGGTLGTWNQLTVRYQDSPKSYVYRLNGATAGTQFGSPGGASNAGGFTLGANGGGAAGFLDGSYGEVIILSANAADHAPIEAYLKSKWGTP